MWDRNKRGKERKEDILIKEDDKLENMQQDEVKRIRKEEGERIKSKMKETLRQTEERTEEMVEETVTEEIVATELCSGEQTFVITQHANNPVSEIGENTDIDIPGQEQIDLFCNEQIETLGEKEGHDTQTKQINTDKDNETPTTDEDMLPNSSDFVSLNELLAQKIDKILTSSEIIDEAQILNLDKS